LLGVKCGLLSLHVVNELSESFGGLRVGYAGHKATVVFYLFVEFGTLVTHGGSAFARPILYDV